MKIVIVSGIWPPTVGGPASHGPDLGGWLLGRGHDVRAVISAGPRAPIPTESEQAAGASGAPEPPNPERARPVRIAAAAARVVSGTRGADVVYSTGMYSRSVAATAATRVPLVIKLVNDPAYDRARSYGLFDGTLEEFQAPLRNPRIRALKRVRSETLARADTLLTPSRYLAGIVSGWELGSGEPRVIPNPAPARLPSAPREELRERLGIARPTFVFAGRLALQKNVPLALDALARIEGARLLLIGDGPERPIVERRIAELGLGERVSLLGAKARHDTLEWVRAADAAVLPSDWENFPHAAVEALAVGTPVLGTAVGGIPEIVESGVNGIVVPPGDAGALAEAMATLAAGGEPAESMRSAAAPSAGRFSRERVFATIEAELRRASGELAGP